MIGRTFDVFDFTSRVNIKASSQRLQLMSYCSNGSCLLFFDDFVLEHMQQPMRFNNDPVLHKGSF